MPENLLNYIEVISLKSLIVGFAVFMLTMIIKIPIKKLTEKLTEEKRKAINSILIFIPLVLSFVANVIYEGLSTDTWMSLDLLEASFTSWILSLAFYAIFERIKIIAKGFLNGKTKTQEVQQNSIKEIQLLVAEITEKLQLDEENLTILKNQISKLKSTKTNLQTNSSNLNISELNNTNIELQTLNQNKIALEERIKEKKEQLENYNKQIIQGG